MTRAHLVACVTEAAFQRCERRADFRIVQVAHIRASKLRIPHNWERLGEAAEAHSIARDTLAILKRQLRAFDRAQRVAS